MNSSLPIPVSRTPISIRVAALADLPFIDALQKQHTRQLGYFPTKQFEDYISRGEVLVAEDGDEMENVKWKMENGNAGSGRRGAASAAPASSHLPFSICHFPSLLGYVISRDRYLKRDELGVIYQLCVVPGKQRGLIGASLIKEAFARSAYGCRLYCCWCAQDLEANYFWEAMGFVPVAFRGGSGKKKRVHIFWQRRICEEDVETKYWYPSQTNSGAIREDRLVFPIPPGVRWSDLMPVLVPREEDVKPQISQMTQIEEKAGRAGRARTQSAKSAQSAVPARSSPPTRRAVQFGRPGAAVIVVSADRGGDAGGQMPEAEALPAKAPKPRRAKIDPTLVAAARELRDRWMERVNDDPSALLVRQGKYEVGRALPGPRPESTRLLLPAA